MEFNAEVRKKQLDNLDQLIASSRKRIESVLAYLGWTCDNVKKDEGLVQCPVNSHHRICPKSWQNHCEKCVKGLEGYTPKSQFLSESIDNPTQSVYIDHNKKIEIITKELSERGPLRLAWNGLDPDPRTSDRFMSTYSPDERLIFYDYVIGNTVGPSPPPEFSTIVPKKNEEEKLLSYEEILTQKRDAKRRRIKYKSVHINRKNHTEVLREVIDGQMEEYKDYLKSQKRPRSPPESISKSNGLRDESIVDDGDDRPLSSISRNSNHSSSSRSTNRRHEHHESSRDRYKRPSPHRSHYSRSERHSSSGRRRSRSRERRKSRERHHRHRR